MKLLCCWGALATALLMAGTPSELNVNCRYTVDAVELAQEKQERLSSALREEIGRLVGEKFSPQAFEDLSRRLRKELHAQSVTHRVVRGNSPDHVKVVFEIVERPARFDLSVPTGFYHSRQGWSGGIEGIVRKGENQFVFGLVSDGDALVERFSGITGRYERNRVGSDRVKLRFIAESYHQQWNGATREFGAEDFLYRARNNFEPQVSVQIARPLTLTMGASFQQMDSPVTAAPGRSSNAVVTTLRFHRRLEGSGSNKHDLDAGYSLRAASKDLGGDYSYQRHHWEFRYMLTSGRSVLIDEVQAGVLSGRAPLFDRFLLGNASTLRGWNKFDLDPLGASRFTHNTVEFRYSCLEMFYDTGAIWSQAQPIVARHSVGVGLRQGNFSVAVAFPLKDGKADPVFMIGVNY